MEIDVFLVAGSFRGIDGFIRNVCHFSLADELSDLEESFVLRVGQMEQSRVIRGVVVIDFDVLPLSFDLGMPADPVTYAIGGVVGFSGSDDLMREFLEEDPDFWILPMELDEVGKYLICPGRGSEFLLDHIWLGLFNANAEESDIGVIGDGGSVLHDDRPHVGWRIGHGGNDDVGEFAFEGVGSDGRGGEVPRSRGQMIERNHEVGSDVSVRGDGSEVVGGSIDLVAGHSGIRGRIPGQSDGPDLGRSCNEE